MKWDGPFCYQSVLSLLSVLVSGPTCLSFLPLVRKNFRIKGFFNFSVIAIPLITPRKPGIGIGNQVSDYLPI